jgi:hypothetical protein
LNKKLEKALFRTKKSWEKRYLKTLELQAHRCPICTYFKNDCDKCIAMKICALAECLYSQYISTYDDLLELNDKIIHEIIKLGGART